MYTPSLVVLRGIYCALAPCSSVSYRGPQLLQPLLLLLHQLLPLPPPLLLPTGALPAPFSVPCVQTQQHPRGAWTSQAADDGRAAEAAERHQPSSSSGSAGAAPELEMLRAAVAAAAAEVRWLKEQEGRPNKDPLVQGGVREMQRLALRLRQVEEAGSEEVADAEPSARTSALRNLFGGGAEVASNSGASGAGGGGASGSGPAEAVLQRGPVAAAPVAAAAAGAAGGGAGSPGAQGAGPPDAAADPHHQLQGGDKDADDGGAANGSGSGSAAGPSGGSVDEGEAAAGVQQTGAVRPVMELAIWRLPALPLFYAGDRTTVKLFARAVLTRVDQCVRDMS